MGNDPSTARALALFNFAARAGGRAAGKRPPHLRRAGRGASPPSPPLSHPGRVRVLENWRRSARVGGGQGGGGRREEHGRRHQRGRGASHGRPRALTGLGPRGERAAGGRRWGGEGSAARAGRRLASATVLGDEADARSPAKRTPPGPWPRRSAMDLDRRNRPATPPSSFFRFPGASGRAAETRVAARLPRRPGAVSGAVLAARRPRVAGRAGARRVELCLSSRWRRRGGGGGARSALQHAPRRARGLTPGFACPRRG